MKNLTKPNFFCLLTLFLAFFFCSVKANAQEAYFSGAYPPFSLEEGSVVELFAHLRDRGGDVALVLEADEVVPVVFQTEVMQNGKSIGRARRNPMPYFPGEMILCPESFDIITLLYNKVSDNGKLPSGEYEVRLTALSESGRALGRSSSFEFEVP